MKIKEIIEVLNAEILVGDDKKELNANSACASDMMSDVLAFVKDQSIMITGLVNPQVVRTAEMMDMNCIIFVRGKVPDDNTVELAKKKDIVILTTKLRMYETCGILYSKGLNGGNNA